MKEICFEWKKIELDQSSFFKRIGHTSNLKGNNLILFGGEIESKV